MTFVRVLLFALLGAGCSHAQHEDARTSASAATEPPTTTICGLVWMTKNLDVAAYRNGDPIPQVQDPNAWVNLKTGAWCWYNNDPLTYASFGRLYNWYAVNDPRGLAPNGWHVLSDADWAALETCVGNDSAGYRIRESGSAHWPGPPATADNSSGFTGLPSGMRSDKGTFSQIGHSAVYWTSVEGSASEAWCARLIHYINNKGAAAMVTGVGYMNKADGYAVRCVRDR